MSTSPGEPGGDDDCEPLPPPSQSGSRRGSQEPAILLEGLPLDFAGSRRRSSQDLAAELRSFRNVSRPLPQSGHNSPRGSLGLPVTPSVPLHLQDQRRGSASPNFGRWLQERTLRRRGSLPAAWAEHGVADGDVGQGPGKPSPLLPDATTTHAAYQQLVDSSVRTSDKLARVSQVVSVLENVLGTLQRDQSTAKTRQLQNQSDAMAEIQRLESELRRRYSNGPSMQPSAGPNRCIKINVGAQLFMTRWSTIDSGHCPRFAQMLASDDLGDGEGNYFVDRNPKYFELILDWLRDPVMAPRAWPLDDPSFVREVKYYGLAEAMLGQLYVAGGFNTDGTAGLATMERYDRAKRRWLPCMEMPAVRHHHDCAVIGGEMYLTGGSGVQSTMVYDAAGEGWRDLTPLCVPRHDHGLVTVSDRIYALGGLDSAEQQLSSVERYDPSTDEWSVFAEMPTGKHSFGCAVVKGLIYLVGGFSGPDRAKTSSVEVFNPVTKMWTEAASLATPRVWLRCVELQGKLYAIGGEDHLPEPVDTVSIYDPATNGWAAGPGMSEKRSSPACCVLADRIYVTGGDDDSDTRLASVEEYDVASKKWTPLPPMRGARANHSCCVLLCTV